MNSTEIIAAFFVGLIIFALYIFHTDRWFDSFLVIVIGVLAAGYYAKGISGGQ